MTNILTIDELKNSVLNANIDDEYIQPAIDEAQSIYLREILGDALLNAIINKINGNNLTGKYLTLVNDYVKPYLSYMIQSIIVVPITYKIRNAGVIQQYDNGFTTTQMKDTQYLKDYYDGKAEFYGNRLTEWLRKNANDIVEYRLSASNVTNPTTSQNVTNIFLGGTKRGKCGCVSTSGGGGTHDTVDWDDITNRPDFATVATSGSYNDLSNKPEIPSLEGYATEQWVENQGYSTFSGDYNDLTNKPELFSGDYNDLENKPNFATVATSGSYNDLSDKPDLTHYVEDTDLASVATSGSYNDLSDKPEIPTVNNATLTIAQGGVTKGTFTANAGTDVTINLDAGGSGSTDWNDIANKPDFATVATSGSYNDLSDKPEIPSLEGYATEQWVENQGYSDFSGDYNDLTNKPTFAQVATSGDYRDLSNTPNFAAVATSGDYHDLIHTPTIVTPVNANWNETDPSELSYIQGKPSLAQVATSGDYSDLSNTPSLGAVATSNDYDDLDNKPTIPTVNNATLTITQGGTTKGTFTANAGTDVTINLEAGGSGSTDWDDIANKPDFATVATSGSYDDLNDKPVIPAAQVNADWDATSGVTQILNKPTLATVATSGSYNDLSDKPVIPAAQVNVDWNASSGVQQILNKPDLDDYVRVTDYEVDKQSIANALADKVETDNLCRINNERLDTNVNFELVRTDSIATLTITQGGTRKGTFTPDSGADVTINLDAGGSGSTNWNDITDKPDFATVATSGSYNDLTNKPNLATVATSGSYNDLSNKPAINNGTLTIQKNGTTIATFTANDDTNKTANITVPTDETDLGLTTETWTFTLQDSSTVTKQVVIKPTV